MDNLSFCMKHLGAEKVQRMLSDGMMADEIAAGIRVKLDAGEPLKDPQEAVKEVLPDFFDEKGRFLHNVLGDYLIDEYGCCKINGAVHIYDNGIYRPGEEALHTAMVDLLPSLSTSRRRECFNYIRVCRQTPEKKLAQPHLIPFRSRVYNLRTDEFLDYDQSMVFLNRFPWDYKPDAPYCASVADTLTAIASNDFDVTKLILESFGNCFHLLNSYRGAVALYGPSGSNGKSTLLNMLRQMVGDENASYLSLQDTAQRFRLMEVYGKAANIGDDIPDSVLLDSSLFKKLATGETVVAEKKGQDPVSFRSYAKFFFALNNLPPVKDKSEAFFSRILLVPLNADFSTAGKRDAGLKDRVWTQEEMEYLVMLSMDGLKRLISQGRFTQPTCVIRAMQEYQLENNPILGFLDEYTNLVGQPTEKVYHDFRRWCEDNGHRNVTTRKRFTKEVCRQTGLRSESVQNACFGGDTGQCYVE